MVCANGGVLEGEGGGHLVLENRSAYGANEKEVGVRGSSCTDVDGPRALSQGI